MSFGASVRIGALRALVGELGESSTDVILHVGSQLQAPDIAAAELYWPSIGQVKLPIHRRRKGNRKSGILIASVGTTGSNTQCVHQAIFRGSVTDRQPPSHRSNL